MEAAVSPKACSGGKFVGVGDQGRCTVPKLGVRIGNSGGVVPEKWDSPEEHFAPLEPESASASSTSLSLSSD